MSSDVCKEEDEDEKNTSRKNNSNQGNDNEKNSNKVSESNSHSQQNDKENQSQSKSVSSSKSNDKHSGEESIEEDDDSEKHNEFEDELREAFNDFDEDQSGTITKEEFGNFMRKLGYRPTLVELQEMMEEVGKDHQGQITFGEFKHIMTKTIRDEFTLNSTVEAFAVFDKNKTGKIKKEALQNILLTKGEQNMTEGEVQDLLDHYITFDANGEIDYKDFVMDTFKLFQ